jgi:predicted branched-subunit amino acid permease
VPTVRRLAALIFMSDANFAYTMTARARGEMDAGVLFGSGLVMWVMWTASTAVGALAGSLFGDVSRFGFDAIMVAYFTAVITGQWKGRADLPSWIAAAAVAVAGTYVLPPGWHIIAGALAGGAVGVWRHVETFAAIAAVTLLAVVTTATRFGGVWIMSTVAITPRTEAFLRYMSVSVLISIVAASAWTSTSTAGPRIWIAVGAAALVMVFSRSVLTAMLAGTAIAALARSLGL